MTAASTVRGLSVSHWKVGAKAKSAWAGADSGQRECDSSLCWLTTTRGAEAPVRSTCLLRSHITSGEQVDLKLLRWEQHWHEIHLIISITTSILHLLICIIVHLCTSKHRNLCVRICIYKDKNTDPGMMGESCLGDGLAVSFRWLFQYCWSFAQLLILYQCTQRLLQ